MTPVVNDLQRSLPEIRSASQKDRQKQSSSSRSRSRLTHPLSGFGARGRSGQNARRPNGGQPRARSVVAWLSPSSHATRSGLTRPASARRVRRYLPGPQRTTRLPTNPAPCRPANRTASTAPTPNPAPSPAS
jgi:hypothetical protein